MSHLRFCRGVKFMTMCKIFLVALLCNLERQRGFSILVQPKIHIIQRQNPRCVGGSGGKDDVAGDVMK